MASSSAPRSIADARDRGSINRVRLDGRQGIFQLNWRQGLLEEVRKYVGETYVSRSGKGSEAGGVFFGQRLGELVHVHAWRPMLRTDDATSHFYLNPREEHLLGKLLQSPRSDAGLRKMEVLGWFRSRTKGENTFDDADLSFHDRFFPVATQFALVIKPSHQRPAHAALYVRDAEQQLGPIPAAVFQLQPNNPNLIAGVSNEALPDVSIRRAAGPPWYVSKRVAFSYVACALFASGLTIGGLQWNQDRIGRNADSTNLGLALAVEGDQLKASWNPSAPALAHAKVVQLMWQGEEQIQLNEMQLSQGFLKIPFKKSASDDILISLSADGAEETAHLIGAAKTTPLEVR